MRVKEIINRLYAYKDESNDERLNDLIDDVIKLIIDECKLINERICDDCIYVEGSQWCEKCDGLEPKHWSKGE